ncbi:MAG TPA: ABC transporter substrate binding protein [Steroidobacteraceae bacterium]|nr:ABC transporter substrate binding protein [Steroidobacteraceae bacterium]
MNGRRDIVLRQLVCVLVAALAMCASLRAHSGPQVLIVFDEDKELPGLAIINHNLQQVLRAGSPEPVEFYTESLNLSRFDAPDYEAVLREHLSRKYHDRQLRLIVAVMEPALNFLLPHDSALFPGVPIVFCGANPVEVAERTLPANVTGVVVKRTFAPTLELALRLQPDTRNVFVIGGTSRFDRQIQAVARRELQSFEHRVSTAWLIDLSMPQLQSKVSTLPPHSLIYYLTLFTDGAGDAFVPHQALGVLAQSANAPVYVALDQYVGLGAVGGHVYSVADLGRQTGEIGVRILRGEAPSDIPVVSASAYRNLFDWRQLDRWRIDEARLPAASEVRYRPFSIWHQYKWYILAGVGLFLVQTLLVVGLFVSRAQRQRAEALRMQSEERRQRAEDEVRRQRDELAHALRVTTLGEMSASFAHELGQPLMAIILNAEAAKEILAARGAAPAAGEALDDVIADANRGAQTLRRLRALFRKESPERVRVDVNTAIEEMLRLLESEMRQRQIRVQFVRSAKPALVLGDAVQLQQVLINLLINAAEAIDGGGTVREIHVESRVAAGQVEILIRDTGIGVTEAQLGKMFEHFVTTKPHGLGMGLAISRSIIQAHGGLIWATLNEGGGVTMHVELPGMNGGDATPEEHRKGRLADAQRM